MGINLFAYSLLAGIAPLLSASLPFLLFKNGINARYYHMLLAVSAGLLFAVATLELLPEAVEMASLDINNSNNNMLNLTSKTTSRHLHQQPAPAPPAHLTTTAAASPSSPSAPSTTTSYSSSSSSTSAGRQDEHNHGHDEDEHDHDDDESKSGLRTPMYGLAFGFLVLIAIELILSGSGGGHSHSLDSHSHGHSHGHDSRNIEIDIMSDGSSCKKDDEHEHKLIIDAAPMSPGSSTSSSQSKLSLTTFIALAVHSLVDGMIISGAFAANSDIGARVALAIVVHKLPDGFVMSSIALSQKKLLGYHPFFYLLLISSMTPLGSLLASIIFGGIPPSTVSFILGFGAGTFLYITTTGILPEILHSKAVAKPSLIGCIIAGYFLFTIIDSSVHVH